MPLAKPVNVLCYYSDDVDGAGPVRVGFICVDDSKTPIMRFARAVFALDDGDYARGKEECFMPSSCDAKKYPDGWCLLTSGVYGFIDSIAVKDLWKLKDCLKSAETDGYIVRVMHSCEDGYDSDGSKAQLAKWFKAASAFLDAKHVN
jgi:hypothetical protein